MGCDPGVGAPQDAARWDPEVVLVRWLIFQDDATTCPLGRPTWRWRREDESSWVPALAVLGAAIVVPLLPVHVAKELPPMTKERRVKFFVDSEDARFVQIQGMAT